MDTVCFSCKKNIDIDSKPGFREECIHCGHDLHSCVQCAHYDPKIYNECKETSADRILEKERANYCEFYLLKNNSSEASATNKKDDLLSAAEALFKKK